MGHAILSTNSLMWRTVSLVQEEVTSNNAFRADGIFFLFVFKTADEKDFQIQDSVAYFGK